MASSYKYDVFVSFRGIDVRRGFLSHLSKALAEHNIDAFVDAELHVGKHGPESLFSEIENSAIALVIFSRNFAYSELCREELVKIVECRNTTGQIVIPVFYDVDPTDVTDLRGSFGDAFAELEHRTSYDEPQRWRHALTDISMLFGLCSHDFRNDSKLIEEIIECIQERLEWSKVARRPAKKLYDVFVSYRGADVARGFLGHLSKAFAKHNIGAFVAEELQKGNDITESIFEAIENSAIAVVIFSQNFADSEWCLNELLKISECRNRDGKIIIPVFYDVDSADVINVTGSYGYAFNQHIMINDEPLVQSWRHALIEASEFAGLHFDGFKSESGLIEEIIECIQERLKQLSQSDSSGEDAFAGNISPVENVTRKQHWSMVTGRRAKPSLASGSISATISASAPATSPAIFKKKHEVFISFRGKDVRAGFLSHLTKALRQHRVDVFVDKELKRGENISESLMEIIEGSYISVVILSEGFAYSVYCMKELVKILECKERNAQIVIPVFYGIDPDDVEEVATTFEDAIAQGRHKFQGIEECWCLALRKMVAVSGFVSGHYESDSDLVGVVTQGVLEKLNHLLTRDSCYDDGFVGIDSRVSNVTSLLYNQDVHIVGIWGLEGIGKTTIARATFDQICDEFESCCFVENVREKSERGIDIIRKEILPQLIGAEKHKAGNSVMMPSSFILGKLSMKKFFLVLDDVSDFNQIKFIIGNGVSYGPGSKIIVTSRDRRLLNYMDSVIYDVETLDPDESLRLFCVRAFKQKTPPEGYSELSMRAIAYAQGLPSVLGGLGFRLYQRSVDEWEAELDELERLKDMSSGNTRRILTNTKDLAKFTGSYLFVLLASLFWKIKIMLYFGRQATLSMT